MGVVICGVNSTLNPEAPFSTSTAHNLTLYAVVQRQIGKTDGLLHQPLHWTLGTAQAAQRKLQEQQMAGGDCEFHVEPVLVAAVPLHLADALKTWADTISWA